MSLKSYIKRIVYQFLDGYYVYKRKSNIMSAVSLFKKIGSDYVIDEPLRYYGLDNVTVGDRVRIGRDWRIEAFNAYGTQKFTPSITIGNNVIIEPYFHVGAIGNISIGNNVLIASKVFITDHSHGDVSNLEDFNYAPADRRLFTKGDISIGNNVWIGEGVCIMGNVTIGDNAIIGANSVVNKSVPKNAIVAGIPAKVIRFIDPNNT